MKLLVYEHVSGGGYSGRPVDKGVLAEGFGMLRSLTADFKAAGNEVTVLLDSRLSKLNPPLAADTIISISKAQEPTKVLASAGKTFDATYLIAPETGQTLKNIVQLAEQTGQPTINCMSNAVAQVSNKEVLYEALQRRGVRVPKTQSFDAKATPEDVLAAIRRLFSYPVVFKPADGVSCGGLSLVQEDSQIEVAVEKAKAASGDKRFIAQEFVRGEAASVSLLTSGEEASAISLNKQNISLAPPQLNSSYEGGEVPFQHPLEAEAFKTAEQVASSFTGLRGYVGVDLVLAEKTVYVLDVNPRLTTSYVGLSKVAGFNVADAMIDVVLKKKLPPKRETKGFAYFSKVRSPKPTADAFRRAAQIKDVITPPFHLDGGGLEPVSLVAAYGNSREAALLRFEEAKKRLFTIISGGQQVW